MKQFWVLLFASVLYYRQISATISFPYHFTGLWPSTFEEKVEKYQFVLDDKERPLSIRHLDANSAPSNNEEGWSVYTVQYDHQGRLIEAQFSNVKGKPVLGKSLGFSKEVVEYDGSGNAKAKYYNSNGRPLKHPEGGWIESFGDLSP